MVEVALFGSLRRFAGGAETVEVEAKTVGEVLSGLAAAHPELGEVMEDQGVSISVNSRVYTHDHRQPIPDEAEVVVIPQLKGG